MTHREPATEAIELTETGPPTIEDGPWDPHAESLGEQPPVGAPTAAEPVQEPPPAQPPRRRRFFPRTIASRLVVGVVGLVVVLVVAISAVTYVAVQAFLLNRLDEQLITTARQPVLRLVNDQNAVSAQTIWVTQLDQSGRVLDSLPPDGPGAHHMSLSAADRQRLAQGDMTPSTVTTTDGHTLRVVSESQPTVVVGVIVIGLSTSDVDRTVHQLFLLELAIGGAAVILAFVATSYGVRLSLRPLYRVTRTARDVTAELSPEGAGLDRRVPVTDAEADTEAGQLAESVNTLLGAVETQFAARVESEQRMRQFLADASHELRTPLTSIRGYAELSRMRRANGVDAAEADTLDRIEHEGTRMSRLVEDLLMLARSDQGAQPQREPVDIGELIDDAVDGARAAFPDRRIDVLAPTGVTVGGDHDQLLRVVRNLVTNAAVHTDPGGPIRVSGRAVGDEIVLQVDDSGPGLPPEEAAHVFERFWRADKARSRARGGTGLGLAIVASIVQAHGGTVRFDSTVETGSTVTVRLPAHAPA